MEEGGRSPPEEAGEPQESGGDAEPGGGRRALLLPPGDPPPPAPHPHPHPHRITNFFIDNILRPEFGRRKEAGGLGGETRRPGAENRRSPAAAPAPGAPLPGSGGGSPGRGEGGGPPGLALHGASKKGGDPAALEAALKARGLSGGDLSVSSDSDSSQASSNAGNQPMLWPAWVYCTRYSDRPSSGDVSSEPNEISARSLPMDTKRDSPLPWAPGRARLASAWQKLNKWKVVTIHQAITQLKKLKLS
nr:homeobox protein engrailed-2 [Anser cygnoides]